MAFFLYASFPNSRNKVRSPTVNANTFHRTAPTLGSTLQQAVEANPNRTYTILSNLSDTYNLGYIYATPVEIDPSVEATFGVPNELVYNENTNTLYRKNDEGTTTDWSVVNFQDVSEVVLPFQNASLESLGFIWIGSLDGGNSIEVAIDEGRG